MAKSSFERVLLAQLEVGEREPYALPERALPLLKQALARAVAGPQAQAEVHRALQLLTAFERDLGSPAVADALVELLRADPRALALSRSFGAKGSLDKARAHRRREGRDEPLRAPRVDAGAPLAAVPLSRLIHQLPSRPGLGATPAVARELRVRRPAQPDPRR